MNLILQYQRQRHWTPIHHPDFYTFIFPFTIRMYLYVILHSTWKLNINTGSFKLLPVFLPERRASWGLLCPLLMTEIKGGCPHSLTDNCWTLTGPANCTQPQTQSPSLLTPVKWTDINLHSLSVCLSNTQTDTHASKHWWKQVTRCQCASCCVSTREAWESCHMQAGRRQRTDRRQEGACSADWQTN